MTKIYLLKKFHEEIGVKKMKERIKADKTKSCAGRAYSPVLAPKSALFSK